MQTFKKTKYYQNRFKLITTCVVSHTLADIYVKIRFIRKETRLLSQI